MRVRLVVSTVVISLFPVLAGANALTDLRGTLGRLPASTHVHGSLDVASTTRSSEDDKAEDGRVTVGFDAGSAGLHVIYAPALLTQATVEARNEARDPEKPTPLRKAAQSVRPLHLAELLDAASAMDVLLESAQLVEVKPAAFGGRPARQLVLKLQPKVSKSDSKHLKKLEASLLIWIGDDGVPLAAEQSTYLKASFLMMSFEDTKKESWNFARAGDRLVASRYERSGKSDGMGQHSTSHTLETIRLEN